MKNNQNSDEYSRRKERRNTLVYWLATQGTSAIVILGGLYQGHWPVAWLGVMLSAAWFGVAYIVGNSKPGFSEGNSGPNGGGPEQPTSLQVAAERTFERAKGSPDTVESISIRTMKDGRIETTHVLK